MNEKTLTVSEKLERVDLERVYEFLTNESLSNYPCSLESKEVDYDILFGVLDNALVTTITTPVSSSGKRIITKRMQYEPKISRYVVAISDSCDSDKEEIKQLTIFDEAEPYNGDRVKVKIIFEHLKKRF